MPSVFRIEKKNINNPQKWYEENWECALEEDRFFSWDWPFLIVMDEIMEDADKIAKEHPEFRSMWHIGYPYF